MKLLIITQHIFPIQTPRSIRSTELIKELAGRGHDVTVYAVLGNYDYRSFLKEFPKIRLKNISIKWQNSPYSSDESHKRNIVDSVLNRLLGKILEFPNLEFMYRIPQILKQEDKYDGLISISNPHHIHWGCAKAKKKYPERFPGVWVADCGDPFMMNDRIKDHMKYFAKYERMFCSLCDYISVPHENAVDGYYPEFRSKIRVIPQGFAFDINYNSTDNPHNEIITFAYAGTFLKEFRNPSAFLDFLAGLTINYKFIIYTPDATLLTPYLDLLKGKLEIRNPINRKELIEELRHMDFLVNFENVGIPACLPSKLIDYMIAQRPVLNVNQDNLNTEVAYEFLNREYKHSYVIENMNDYHISGVVDKFLDLLKSVR